MPDARKARHAEIERRYRKRRRKGGRASIAALRVRDLNRIFDRNYGPELPDDDAGREDAQIMAHHLASLSGDPRKHIGQWLRLRAPWTSLKEAEDILVEAITRPQRWRADKLAWRMKLTEADRRSLGITTIGAIDLSKAERTRRRRKRQRLNAETRRRAKGSNTRAAYLASVTKPKPWTALGMSRAKWYRLGKPTA